VSATTQPIKWPFLGLALVIFTAADLLAPHLPDPGHTGQLVYLVCVTIPLMTLVVQACGPAHTVGPRLLVIAVAAFLAALLLIHLGHPATPATVAKLIAAISVGLVLAGMLRNASEAITIALVIAAVDIYSVAAGPTHEIVHNHPGVLDDLALNLRVLGTSAVVQIGASDLVFFALFTAAAIRLGLRRWTTWAAMTASFGLTIVLADHLDTALPALPLLSAAFLAANADLFRARSRQSTIPPNERGV
jgi:hypothetical protein